LSSKVGAAGAFGNALSLFMAFHKAETRYNRDVLKKAGFSRIMFDPDRIMRSCFEKMIRAAGLNIKSAWVSWRLSAL